MQCSLSTDQLEIFSWNAGYHVIPATYLITYVKISTKCLIVMIVKTSEGNFAKFCGLLRIFELYISK